jgi:hypothetical protein
MQKRSQTKQCPHCKGHWKNTCVCGSCRKYNKSSSIAQRGICEVCEGKGRIPRDLDKPKCTHCNDYKNRCGCNDCRVQNARGLYEKGICKVCGGTGRM